uniref:FG-GAP-like repeat-containing protein n=1 Tax=Falsiroseomonas oryziterrae TaxID=2911368 RepID=UPI001F1883A2
MAFIAGSDGNDNLVGTGENDTFLGAGGSDVITGGGGFDIVVYWSSPFAVGIRLFANVTDNDGFGGTDQLFGISGAAGSGWDDIIFGNDFGNLLLGLTGNDSIFGLDGDDLIRGAEGNDSLDGGEGTDRLFLFGNRADYTIVADGDRFIITDNFPAGREQNDGVDTVTGFEEFQFADRRIAVANILDPNAPGIVDQPPPAPGPSPVGGFAPATQASREFGFGASAGGWSSNTVFPRMMADANGDGRDDIVGFGNDGVLVSLNTGAGGFGPAYFASREFGFGASAGGWSSNDVFPRMMADVNGDGRDDIVGFGNDGVL